MTEPTREPEYQVEPAGPEAGAHDGSGSDTHADVPETGVPFPGADPLPWIKRAPSRRLYDRLLLVPFFCIGASIGTLALATGIFRHIGLIFAFAVLFAWIRAGLAITKAAHVRWLMVMGGFVVIFLACGYLAGYA